jgi:hypothetical protein
MSFNPLNTVKNFLNQSGNTISDTYDKISTDVLKVVTPIVQTVKPSVIPESTPEIIQPKINVETKINVEQILENPADKLAPYEKQFESKYVGCFEDDPINPSMSTSLGNVSNISECIDLGKKNNFAYVGLLGGNQCFASNKIPNSSIVDRYKYCNVGCDDIGTGNCGGFYYNQVYKTSDFSNSNTQQENKTNTEIKTNTVNVLENFIDLEDDLKKINLGLNKDNFNCRKPLNTYFIFFWLIVLLFLIYLLFEYLYKKNKEKIL